MFFLVVAALFAAAAYFLMAFYVPNEQAETQGNVQYSDDEIRWLAMPGFKEHNSLYLRFFRNHMEFPETYSIDSIDAEYLDRNHVRLHVVEEYPVGYLLQDGCRWYFNAAGIVTECREETEQTADESAKADTGSGAAEAAQQGTAEEGNGQGTTADTTFRPALADVSQVTGLTTEQVELQQQIETDNSGIFRTLLTLEKLIHKLNVHPDEIRIRDGRQLTLVYGGIEISLGTDSLLDEKMSRTAAILPQLEGMEGVLHLETWSPGTVNIVFSRKTDTETDNFVD